MEKICKYKREFENERCHWFNNKLGVSSIDQCRNLHVICYFINLKIFK